MQTQALVTVEKLHQDRLWILDIHDFSDAAVDEWENTVRAYIASLKGSPQRYLVYDTSAIPDLGFTKYMRQRTTALAYDNREATGRVGLVLRLSPMMRRIIELFLQITGSRIQPLLRVKIFRERDEAVKWVAEIVPQDSSATVAAQSRG